MNALAHIVVTFFYVGYMRPMPGTWGSILSLPVAYIIYIFYGALGVILASLATYFLGLWAINVYEKFTGDHDPPEVVIDEVVGQWIALTPITFGALHADVNVIDLWPGLVLSLILFRIFDIWKPGIIGTIAQRKDATGVILDDAYAGLYAAMVVALIAMLWHGSLFT